MFNITTTPLNHQYDALSKIVRSKVSALFAEMGTGKTLISIMLIKARLGKWSNVVWFCPVTLRLNTVDQFLSHTTLTREDIFVFGIDSHYQDQKIIICGLETIASSDRTYLQMIKLINNNSFVIVDESIYIKSVRSKRTKRVTNLSRECRYRMILNGTPLTQGIEDLYAQYTFLSPKILSYRTWKSFVDAHIIYSDRFKGMIVKRVDVDKIIDKVEPYTFQIKKSECIELPDKIYQSRHIDLSNSQKALYDLAKEKFEDDLMVTDLDQIGVAIYVLYGRLLSIINGICPSGLCGKESSLIENEKTNEVINILENTTSTHIIIWCLYIKNIEQLKESIKSHNVYTYDGTLSQKQKSTNLEEWRINGGVFIATQQSGGFGLTLTECDLVIYYGNGFKYGDRLQSEDRVHRIGQSKSPVYIDIWTNTKLDSKIANSLRFKSNTLDDFKDELELANLNNKKDIKKYILSRL